MSKELKIPFGVLNFSMLILALTLFWFNQEVYVQSMCLSLATISIINLWIFPFHASLGSVWKNTQSSRAKGTWLKYQTICMLLLAWIINSILQIN